MFLFQTYRQKISEFENSLSQRISALQKELQNTASPPTQERQKAIEAELKSLQYFQDMLSEKNKRLIGELVDEIDRNPQRYKNLSFLLQNNPHLLVAIISMDERSSSEFKFKDLRINADMAEKYASTVISKMKELGVLDANWSADSQTPQELSSNQMAIFRSLLPQAYRGKQYLDKINKSDIAGENVEQKAANFVEKFIAGGFLANITTASFGGRKFHAGRLNQIHTTSEFFTVSKSESKAMLDDAYLDSFKAKEDSELQSGISALAKIEALGLKEKFIAYANSNDLHDASGKIDDSKLVNLLSAYLGTEESRLAQKEKGKYATKEDFMADSRTIFAAKFLGFDLSKAENKASFSSFLENTDVMDSGLYSVQKLFDEIKKFYHLKREDRFMALSNLLLAKDFGGFLEAADFIQFKDNKWSLTQNGVKLLEEYGFSQSKIEEMLEEINSKWNSQDGRFSAFDVEKAAKIAPLSFLVNLAIRKELSNLGLVDITDKDIDDWNVEFKSTISNPITQTSALRKKTEETLRLDVDDEKALLNLFSSYDGYKVLENIRNVVATNVKGYQNLDSFLIATYDATDQENAASKFFSSAPQQQQEVASKCSQLNVIDEQSVLRAIQEVQGQNNQGGSQNTQ